MLVLTDDALLLFDVLPTGNGTLVFWSSLYSISAVRLDKMNQKASFTIFNNENNNEYYLHLNFEKILHFRDALVKKMRTLKIKSESIRVMKGQSGNRFTKKEINLMKLEDVEKAIDDLEKRIRKGEVNDYTVNTFSVLCGKAMEELAQIGSPNFEKYLKLMQEVLGLEEVRKFTEEAQEEMKNMGDSK
jgi:hydroxymethylpyrimidine pyrophosphatase-like HAD family hydrolase